MKYDSLLSFWLARLRFPVIVPNCLAFLTFGPRTAHIVLFGFLETSVFMRKTTAFLEKIKQQEMKVRATIPIDMTCMKLHLHGRQGTEHDIVRTGLVFVGIATPLKSIFRIDDKI
jgi:hypothetical protein